MTWGSPIEVEIRNRVLLSIWAYAYEMLDETLVSDDVFDAKALEIRPEMATGHKKLDAFFATEFAPYTGSWVRKHPDQRGLMRALVRHKDYLKCRSSIPSTT